MDTATVTDMAMDMDMVMIMVLDRILPTRLNNRTWDHQPCRFDFDTQHVRQGRPYWRQWYFFVDLPLRVTGS